MKLTINGRNYTTQSGSNEALLMHLPEQRVTHNALTLDIMIPSDPVALINS